MRIENPLFEKLAETTSIMDQTMARSLKYKSIEPSFRRNLSVLHSALVDLNVAGKAACAQWALASAVKDDPRALPVMFCLDRIKNNNTDISAEAFLYYAQYYHPVADGKPDLRQGPKARRHREKMKQQRIRNMVLEARDLRRYLVKMIGNPPPTDLFTRVTLFGGLSEKEILAAFVACIADQDTDWIATAFSEAQKARAHMAMGDNQDKYVKSLQLSEIYLRAIQLHLKNIAGKETRKAPIKPPPLVSRKKDKKLESATAKPPSVTSGSRSSQPLPYTGKDAPFGRYSGYQSETKTADS